MPNEKVGTMGVLRSACVFDVNDSSLDGAEVDGFANPPKLKMGFDAFVAFAVALSNENDGVKGVEGPSNNAEGTEELAKLNKGLIVTRVESAAV